MPEELKPTALVVDDDRAIRNLVSALLRREGFDVDTAADGVEAVLKLGVHEYDFLALDLMMPGVSGREILRFLAENRPPMLERVLVMTAAADAEIFNLMSTIPCRLIRKPFDIEQFTLAIRKCKAR